MTEPVVVVVWCATCGIHYALPWAKHCPVCLDERDRKRRRVA